jgi:3-oxoacyl-[acyl-carrier protein] reductase
VDLGLTGKACIVTGATRGIGRATAQMLHAEGAHVLEVARTGDDTFHADVTNPEDAAAIVAACVERYGTVDALVNNAGTSFVRSLDELSDHDWQSQWELHVMGPMRLMREAAPLMAARGGGRIVNVCSSAGKRPSLTNPAYAVTKAAQLSLSRVFADRYAADGVLVNAVAPGAVSSPLWTDEGGLADQAAGARGISRDEALDAQAKKIPLGRFASPEEIASVIVFLCSERASTVTGAAWSADGGTFASII